MITAFSAFYFILQALYLPLKPATDALNEVAAYSSLVFTIIITVEAIVKLLSRGLILEDGEQWTTLYRRIACGENTTKSEGKEGDTVVTGPTGLIEATEDVELQDRTNEYNTKVTAESPCEENGNTLVFKVQEDVFVRPYLRSGWNIFDVVILITAWATFIPGVLYSIPKWSHSLRLILLLKPLSSFPPFKKAASPVLRSLPKLGTLLFVSVLVMSIWATAGLHLYQSSFHNNCFYTQTDDNGTVEVLPFGEGVGYTPLSNDPSQGPAGQLCSTSKLLWKGYQCPSPVIGTNCNTTEGCNQTCTAYIDSQPAGGSPEWGELSFDNFGYGLVFAFFVYSAVYWGQPTGYMMEASGGWSYFFSAIVVLVGFLVCYNLVIIVIYDAFRDEKKSEEEHAEEKGKKIAQDIIKEREKIYHKLQLNVRTVPSTSLSRSKSGSVEQLMRIEGRHTKSMWCKFVRALVDEQQPPTKEFIENFNKNYDKRCQASDDKREQKLKDKERIREQQFRTLKNNRNLAFAYGRKKSIVAKLVYLSKHVMLCIQKSCEVLSKDHNRVVEPIKTFPNSVARYFTMSKQVIALQHDLSVEDPAFAPHFWLFRRIFQGFVYACVIGNVIALACQYEGMSDAYANRIDTASNVFVWCFVVEAVIKIVGLGKEYFLGKSAIWNWFDFIITGLSLASIFTDMASLSAFRSLRAIRVLRLFTVLEQLQLFLKILLDVMIAVAGYILLLLYAGMSFAILGMHLFGNAWSPGSAGPDTPRANFNTFFNAIGVVINNMDGTYDDSVFFAMHITTPFACLFYQAEIIFGIVLLLNLVIATLYDGFQSRRQLHKRSSNLKGKNHAMRNLKTTSRDRDPRTEEARARAIHWQWLRDIVMLLTIALNCVALILQNPSNSNAMRYTVQYIYLSCLCVYAADLILKIAQQRARYFENFFNNLDLIVIILTTIGVVRSYFTKAHILLSFVPLLLLGRVKKLRNITENLVFTIIRLYDIALIGLLLLLAYAVVGMETFLGDLNYCSSSECCVNVDGSDCQNVTVSTDCVGYASSSTSIQPLECYWTHPFFGFDNLWQAFSTLIVLISGAATNDVWDTLEYSKGEDLQPYDSESYAVASHPVLKASAAYMLTFNVVCFVFFINVLTGRIFDSYLDAMHENGPLSGLDETQEDWTRMQQYLLRTWPRTQLKSPKDPIRGFLFTFVCPADYRRTILGRAKANVNIVDSHKSDNSHHITSSMPLQRLTSLVKSFTTAAADLGTKKRAKSFRYAIALVVFVQFTDLSLQHWGQSENWSYAIWLTSLICTSILCLEAVMEIVVFGVVEYFSHAGNWFRVFVSFGALPGLILSGVSDTVSRILIIPRLLAVFRLRSYVRRSNAIMDALIVSMPLLFNAMLLLGVVLLCFAAVGVEVFDNIYPNVKDALAMTLFFNWQNVVNAFMMLFVCTTGDAWDAFLADTSVSLPLCTNPHCETLNGTTIDAYNTSDACTAAGYDWSSYRCGTEWASVFFVPFIIIVFFIILNVLVAIVLEGYESCSKGQELDACIRQYELLWQKYDSKASGTIPVQAFGQLLLQLKGPLGATELLQKVKDPIFTEDNIVEFARYLDKNYNLITKSMQLKSIKHKKIDSNATTALSPVIDSNANTVQPPVAPLPGILGKNDTVKEGDDDEKFKKIDWQGDDKIDYHEGLQKLTIIHYEINIEHLPNFTKDHLVGMTIYKKQRQKARLQRMQEIQPDQRPPVTPPDLPA